jgi:cbb3-type cytochrome c oxidase subunit III
MKALKLGIALIMVASFSAACGGHNATGGNANRAADKNAPAAPVTNANTANRNAEPMTQLAATGEGAALYESKGCATCHGADGKGNATMKDIPNFTDAAWQKKTGDAAMTAGIRNGKPPMPAYKNRLTDEQIQTLVAYIRQFAR